MVAPGGMVTLLNLRPVKLADVDAPLPTQMVDPLVDKVVPSWFASSAGWLICSVIWEGLFVVGVEVGVLPTVGDGVDDGAGPVVGVAVGAGVEVGDPPAGLIRP